MIVFGLDPILASTDRIGSDMIVFGSDRIRYDRPRPVNTVIKSPTYNFHLNVINRYSRLKSRRLHVRF